jgi:uncharacterized protein YmfQ (DUF2313 family)
MSTSPTWQIVETPAPAQTTPAIAFSHAAYVRQLRALLPPGLLLTVDRNSVLTKTLEAIALELARIDGRAKDFVAEIDPRTATETLEDWERILSLPDERVTAIPATTEERRIVITQKYATREGANFAFYARLVAACGHELVSVTKYATSVLRVGARCGNGITYPDARCFDSNWAYAFRLNVVEGPIPPGLARADFERVIRHVTHAHVQVFFAY